MGDMVMSMEANPGAMGSGNVTLYFNLAGQLCYVGNDGVEHVVSQQLKRKTGDQSVASNTTLQNDANLNFAIGVNEEWLAELSLDVGALLSTTGLQLGVSFPVGAQIDARASLAPDIVAATNLCALRTTANATGMNFTAAGEAGVSNAAVKVSIWALNGANAGTVQLMFCQSANSVTNVTLRKGSGLVAHRVA